MTATGTQRWLRISLRTMLVVVTLLCVLLAFVGRRAYLGRQQRLALEAIHRARTNVWYEHQATSSVPDEGYDSSAPTPGPAWLRSIVGDDFFRTPDGVVFFTDGSVVPVPELSQLTSLRLLVVSHTTVSDADVRKLTTLANLQRLHLNDTDVTDAVVESLQSFR